MKKNPFPRKIALLLAFTVAFGLAPGLAGCSGRGARAATMFLRKTEGTVNVADAEEQSVEAADNLGLYSGYTVGTKAESFAWIDLDKVKLAKLDENSEIHIVKEGKNLSIDVNAGSLFFHVAEPLAEDETMEIRSSSMLVGIRGTCGWVEAPDAQHMNVYILEGRVECTAGESTAAVNAGEMAAMTADGAIAVKTFEVYAVPGFVTEELQADEALNGAVLEASGLDVAASPLAGYADVLNRLMRGKPLYAEILDFEADGNPELMVLALEEDAGGRKIFANIYRKGPDGAAEQVRVSGSFLDDDASGFLSLAESGGRLYLREYREYQGWVTSEDHHWRDYYWGPVAQKDTEGGDWNYVEMLQKGDYEEYRYYRSYRDARGLCARAPNGYDESVSAAEYTAVQASFREVKVLISLSADGELAVLPDPAEMPMLSEG